MTARTDNDGDSTTQLGHRFPRLNLARSQATRMEVRGRYNWSDTRASLLNEFLQPLEFFPDAEGYVSTTRYTGRDAEKSKHSIMALIWRYEDVIDEVIFQVVYSVDDVPGGRSGPFSHRESQFLTVVQALGEPSSLVASADFRFAGKTETDLWFPLPARLSGKTNETTIEVRGVRGSILASDDRPNYSFVLDRTANQDVTLDIRFDLHGEFEPAILRTTFARAVKAVPELVVL